MALPQIIDAEHLEKLIMQMGFLPFFKNDIPRFSIDEFTPKHLWFSSLRDGPWEWKGPVISGGHCVYGKLFQQKAGYVSLQYYPELLNYRRALYRPTPQEKNIYQTLLRQESLLSKELKKLCGYVQPRAPRQNPFKQFLSKQEKALLPPKPRRGESFETAITRLQMSCYVVIADFEYLYDHEGNRYGWGIARYTTPEALYGSDIFNDALSHTPEESKNILLQHLHQLLPTAQPRQLLKIIG
jgi:hypothetical protein